jgi:hypothetical protein
MKTARAMLKSISPYSQSKHYEVPTQQGESHADKEARTWRERLHVNTDGFVFIQPMAFKNCLSEAAKYLSVSIPGKGKSTFTKHIEAGVLVVDPLVLPIKKADVSSEWNFVPADGVRGSGKRVNKCFPLIHSWQGEVIYQIMDETVLNRINTPDGDMTAFEHILRQSGLFIGIGRFRPRNNGFYGRFIVEGKIQGI